ncbi:TldD/PmbA family protein [Bdellovibrio sp. HCB209]|uniref:TldD/PmbA family protein n=1 Tax=Bdellovibrio sp. HCB209 TaxID=3394354 RepID=UPI0039B5B9F0
MNILGTAEKALSKALKNGSDKASVAVSFVEEQVFNIDGNQLTLSKTGFDQSLTVKSLIDQRQASTQGNQFDENSIHAYAENAATQAKASPQDAANDICPAQGTHSFTNADVEFDPERVKNLLIDLMQQRQELFPTIKLETSSVKFIKTKQAFITSENTSLTSFQSHLAAVMFFTAKDGTKSSSFNYTDMALSAIAPKGPESLLNHADLRMMFQQSSQQVNSHKLPEKFEGDVILGPQCVFDFIHSITMYLHGQYLFTKSSFLSDKLGSAIASPLWNLTANPVGKGLPEHVFWTADGYLSQNQSIIENGILKEYRLNDYYSKKMKHAPDRSERTNMELAAGNTSLREMISGIKKGILLNRYSGDMSENGQFAGVAKNSYYIENGELKFPLNETMVSGNLKNLLMDTQSISKEITDTGLWKMPWVHVKGITVS